jgi:hypothetical protein
MPLYNWIEKKTDKEVEILRSFSKYSDSPSKEEALEAGLTEEEYATADWIKVIGKGIKVIPGESWGPGKGNW